MTQTFWSRYKVLIGGIFSAIVAAVAPIIFLAGGKYDYKALIITAIIAGATFLGKEARGKNWTIVGQFVSAGLAIVSLWEKGTIDPLLIIGAIAASFFSIPISPIKLSTYESAPVIERAKDQAAEIKAQRDLAAEQKKE